MWKWILGSADDFLKLTACKLTHEQLVIGDNLGRDDVEHAFGSPYALIQILKVPPPGESPKQQYEQHEDAICGIKYDVDAQLILHFFLGDVLADHDQGAHNILFQHAVPPYRRYCLRIHVEILLGGFGQKYHTSYLLHDGH